MNHKILITGAAGYIGSVLTPLLLQEGHEIIAYDNLTFGGSSLIACAGYKKFNFINGDIRDKIKLEQYIRKSDLIIPLAAVVGQSACDLDPWSTKSVNIEAHKDMIDLLSKNQKVLFPSTQSGYGVMKSEDYCTEESILNPISSYGISKVEIEKALLDRGNAITLRSATVFGMSPRMRIDLLVNDFTYRAWKDGVIVLFEKNFRRNFIHVRDLSNAFIHCINNWDAMKNKPYNVGLSAANLSKLQLAQAIKEILPNLIIIENNYIQDPDKRDYLVSNSRIESMGWVPEKSLKDGILEMKTGFEMLGRGAYQNVI